MYSFLYVSAIPLTLLMKTRHLRFTQLKSNNTLSKTISFLFFNEFLLNKGMDEHNVNHFVKICSFMHVPVIIFKLYDNGPSLQWAKIVGGRL